MLTRTLFQAFKTVGLPYSTGYWQYS